MSVRLRNRPMQAFGLALLVEAGVLAATAAILSGAAASKPALSEPVTITLVSDAPPPDLPPKPPQAKPKPKHRLSQPRAPTPPVTATPLPMPQAPAPLAQKPEAFTEPLSPPPLPAPSGKADPGLEYAVKVRAAVQAAVYYPPAALAMHFVGRVRVQFHLQDGIPGVAQVLLSSGIGLFDRAALRTVHNAHYPAPPTELRGADRVYQVWVEFRR